MFLAVGLRQASAQDVVHVLVEPRSELRTRVTGEVIDYTGRELTLRRAGGEEQRFPTERVAEIETTRSAEQLAARQFSAEFKFAEALRQLETALAGEKRAWVRREILAEMVWCHRELDDRTKACEAFLALVESDRETVHFSCIPLAWLNEQPSPALERQSQRWLSDDQSSVARLMGASHLLSTAARPAAIERLKQLAVDRDPRIRALATAQLWRTDSTTVSDGELAARLGDVEKMPAGLRGGAALVLGQALVAHEDPRRAAMWLLRLPLVDARPRRLASHALQEAAKSLEAAGEQADALLREEAPVRLVASGAASEEERYLEGLRSRRLQRLAEAYCQEQLDRADLAPRRRATLVIELSRSFVSHALATSTASSESLWQQAGSVVDDFLSREPEGAFAPLIELQGAEVRLARGEALAEQVQSASNDDPLLEAPRRELREASERFAKVHARLSQFQRSVATNRAADVQDKLTAGELRALDKQVRFRQAQALVSLARTYARGTRDWTTSLAQAAELLAPLAQMATTEPLGWRSRLAQVECLRLSENAADARQKLALLLDLNPPEEVKLLAKAEQLQLAIATRRLDDVETLLQETRPLSSAPAELDLARLEAQLTLWQDASRRRDEQKAGTWRAAAEELLAQFDSRHGALWARRAEGLLVSKLGNSPQTADPAVLARVADAFYSQGRADEALAAYDRAREVAETRRDTRAAFDLAYKAAAVEHARDAHRPARERFRALALAARDDARSADAHLLAIFHAAQEMKLAGNDVEAATTARETYVVLLEEHLEHWPQSPTASEAAWRLGRLHAHDRAWEPAIAAYRRVAQDHARYTETLEEIVGCYTFEIAELAERGEPTANLASEAADYFARAATDGAARPPAQFNAAQRMAALCAARFWVGHLQGSYDRAAQLLTAASAGANVPLEWRSQAVPLLIVALAAEERHDDARRLVGEVASAPAAETLAMLERLARVAEGARAESAEGIVAIELAAVEQLRTRRGELDKTAARRLDLLAAGALAAAGRNNEAESLYRALAQAHPDRGEVQEQFAAWLASRGDEASLREALAHWGQIDRRSRPGSDRWFRAKYALADLHHRLRDDAFAVRIIKYTQTLYPSLGGPELKARFEKLLAECEPR